MTQSKTPKSTEGKGIKREIKFRAWDSKLKYMFYDGDTNGFKNTTYPISVTNKGVIYCEKGKWGRENEVRDENGEVGYKQWEYDKYHWQVELMQYTGLKDKNGKEIYEGDIFNCHYSDETKNHHKWEVVWSDEYASFKLKRIGSPCNQSMVNQNVYDYSGWNGEVIGNIYENPELVINHPTHY